MTIKWCPKKRTKYPLIAFLSWISRNIVVLPSFQIEDFYPNFGINKGRSGIIIFYKRHIYGQELTHLIILHDAGISNSVVFVNQPLWILAAYTWCEVLQY